GEGKVPDASGLSPRGSAETERRETERSIRNPGVDVDAAVVVFGLHVAAHVRWLRVLADPWIVVGGAGLLHGAQRLALHAGREQSGTDQPIRLLRGLAERVLLHQRAEHVGHALVARAGLPLILEVCLALGD